MRIGIFSDTYLPYISGLVTSELMLKKALEDLGHEVYIVTANLENFKYINDKNNKIIKISGLPVGIYDARLTGIYSVSAISEIKKWKLDIIHSQTEFGIGTFARIVAKQLNIPLVHTYHTMYEDYVYYLTKGHFDKPSKKLVEYLTRFYCDKTVSELIVPSRKIYNLFVNKYNVNKKINIIGTGIDIDKFKKENYKKEDINKLRKKYNIKENDFVIGSVSRIAKEKSIDRIINTFPEVLKKIPTAKLLIVGDGPDKEDLMKLAVENKIKENVIFTGKVELEKIGIYYQLMNLFVTFSITETQGLTVIEAMASGLPVLAIKDDSFIDSIKHNKNGFLFNKDEEYLDYVYKLYSDKKLYEKQSINALELAKDHSSISFGEKVLKVYYDTIDEFNQKNSLLTSIKGAIKSTKKSEKESKNN
ncbi:MAG: glycosyltransferase [Bacilli bacterium]|nr:glycosyltransferase [Bacilli bacterium]